MEKNYSNNNVTFNSMASDIVVGLDIGTTKVATIVGYLNNRGKIEILGHGKSASKGVEYGLIQNLLKAQESIRSPPATPGWTRSAASMPASRHATSAPPTANTTSSAATITR